MRTIRCSAMPSIRYNRQALTATSARPRQQKCIFLCPIPDPTLLQRARPTLRRLSENNYCYQILYRALEKPPTIFLIGGYFHFLLLKLGYSNKTNNPNASPSKRMFGLFSCGRSDRTRTCSILLPKQARYQLRHTSILNFK